MSDSRSFNDLKNQFLEDSGFIIKKQKHFYEKYLAEHVFDYEDIFVYKSIQEIGEPNFLEVFDQVTKDDAERSVAVELYYQSMKEDAGEKFDQKAWQIVILDNKNIGMIMPQVFYDKPEEGSVFHFGLLPEYRKKQYGRLLHSNCLDFLKKQGVTRYIGSTLIENYAMNKLFEINGCKKTMTRYFYHKV